jgi:tryptophan synthase beta chain
VLSETEGIIPALEPAHALAHVLRAGGRGDLVLVGLSGRGDKDVATVAEVMEATEA